MARINHILRAFLKTIAITHRRPSNGIHLNTARHLTLPLREYIETHHRVVIYRRRVPFRFNSHRIAVVHQAYVIDLRHPPPKHDIRMSKRLPLLHLPAFATLDECRRNRYQYYQPPDRHCVPNGSAPHLPPSILLSTCPCEPGNTAGSQLAFIPNTNALSGRNVISSQTGHFRY